MVAYIIYIIACVAQVAKASDKHAVGGDSRPIRTIKISLKILL